MAAAVQSDGRWSRIQEGLDRLHARLGSIEATQQLVAAQLGRASKSADQLVLDQRAMAKQSETSGALLGGADVLPCGGRYGEGRVGALAGGFLGGAGGSGVRAGGTRLDGGDCSGDGGRCGGAERYDDDGGCSYDFPWRSSVRLEGDTGATVARWSPMHAHMGFIDNTQHPVAAQLHQASMGTDQVRHVSGEACSSMVSDHVAHKMFDEKPSGEDAASHAEEAVFKGLIVSKSAEYDLFDRLPHEVVWDEEILSDGNVHDGLLQQLACGGLGEAVFDEAAAHPEHVVLMDAVALESAAQEMPTDMPCECEVVLWDEMLTEIGSHDGLLQQLAQGAGHLVDEMTKPIVEPFTSDMLTHDSSTSLKLEIGVYSLDELCDERPLEDDAVAQAEQLVKVSVSSEGAAQEVFDRLTCETVVWDEQRPYLKGHEGLLQQVAGEKGYLDNQITEPIPELVIDEVFTNICGCSMFLEIGVDMGDVIITRFSNSLHLSYHGTEATCQILEGMHMRIMEMKELAALVSHYLSFHESGVRDVGIDEVLTQVGGLPLFLELGMLSAGMAFEELPDVGMVEVLHMARSGLCSSE
ncbi:hypothetical protein ACP70R_002619 [Stipagrostis hirtigluma subsp. patula]